MSNRGGARGSRGREEPPSPEHRHDGGGMADEDRAWLESDLSRLSEFEPYEWAEGELEAGEPDVVAFGRYAKRVREDLARSVESRARGEG